MSEANSAAGAQHITGQAAFDADVLQAKHPVLVDFYADWCGPCQMAAPIMDKLSGEYAGKAAIIKIDVDNPENRAISAQYGVMSIPTVLLFKDGEVASKNIGFIGEKGYRQMIDQSFE